MNSMIPKSIKVRLKASHFNSYINKNALNYTAKGVHEGADSWVKPFVKPQLVGHIKSSDPIGRVVGYRLAQSDGVNDEPTDYIELEVLLNDKAAIEKVLDGRYNTVSVGSKSSKVYCSVCSQNIIEDGLCEHKKGSLTSRGERVHWKIDQIDYVECSFVNEPADPYAGIDQIDVGFGFVPYKDFLDNQETLLTEVLTREGSTMTDKVQVKDLSDSSFCYVSGTGEDKVRKFPAHTADHVRNGLAKLATAEISDSAKGKILATLKRRAKRFNVKVSEDNVFSKEAVSLVDALDPLYGINDGFTEEEQTELADFFKANPDIDTMTTKEETTQETEDEVHSEPDKMKKDELLAAYKALVDRHKTDIESRDNKIETLDKKVADLGTVLTERENEVNRYIDQAASFEKKLRDSVIANIIDLKMSDTKEDRKGLAEKLESRKLQSLVDTLSDLRIENNETTDETVANKDRVKDPTQTDTEEGNLEDRSADAENDPWSIFEQDNRLAEV